MRTTVLCMVVVLAVAWGWFVEAQSPPAGAAAGPPPSPSAPGELGAGLPSPAGSPEDQTDSPQTFWEILKASGMVGLLIMLLSVGAVALVIEHAMTIRGPVLMPPGLADEVRELLATGRVAQADQRCRMEPSVLAYILGAGLTEVEGGWPEVEKGVEDAIAEQSARLFRKIEYLNVIGNIAPMLGLLGTVMGMIMAFREVAMTQGAARAADLANGIYLALVTTVQGLVVAIPALAAFAVFRSRVDQLVAEVTYTAQHVLAPLKRRLKGAVPQPSGTQPAPLPPPVKGGR